MVRQLVMWGCCQNSLHKLAVDPEEVQTLTWQGIALAVGNVTVLDGRSHRCNFHLRVSVVVFSWKVRMCHRVPLQGAPLDVTWNPLGSQEGRTVYAILCVGNLCYEICCMSWCSLSCLSTAGLVQRAVWGLWLSWRQLKGWGQIICFYKGTVPVPTERAHRVITASKGVVSLGEPNTTGDGLILLQVPLPGPLTVSEAAPIQLCFTGVECFWQQRINGAGGYLCQMPATTGCGAGGCGVVGPCLAFEVISFWSVRSRELQRLVELGSRRAMLLGLSGLTMLWQGRP